MMEAYAALVAGVFLLANTWLAHRIHRQVTVNSHSQKNPTILDRFADLEEKIDEHMNWTNREMSKVWRAIGRLDK